MRLLKHKRGTELLQDILLLVTEIFFVGMVAVALMSYAGRIKDDTLYYKIHHAKDISFLIDAMQSVPGNVLFYYNESFGFKYNFKNNRVEVYDPEATVSFTYSIYYLFANSTNLNFIYPASPISKEITETKTKLVFKKTDSFEINPLDENIDYRVCPVISMPGNTVEINAPSKELGVQVLLSMLKIGTDKNNPLIILEYGYVSDVNAEIYFKLNKTERLSTLRGIRLACLISNNLKSQGISSVILPSESDRLKNDVSVLVNLDITQAGKSLEKQIAAAAKRFLNEKR